MSGINDDGFDFGRFGWQLLRLERTSQASSCHQNR